MITAEKLRELLDYDPNSGVFTWLVRPAQHVKIGDIAGSLDSDGYRQIRIDGKLYLAHRLAWLHNYARWPSDQVDHKNGVPDDNRIANLRECSNAQNGQNRAKNSNNTSGFTGVSLDKSSLKWKAQIMTNGRPRTIGYFDAAEEAGNAYLAAKSALHQFQPVPRNLEQ